MSKNLEYQTRVLNKIQNYRRRVEEKVVESIELKR